MGDNVTTEYKDTHSYSEYNINMLLDAIQKRVKNISETIDMIEKRIVSKEEVTDIELSIKKMASLLDELDLKLESISISDVSKLREILVLYGRLATRIQQFERRLPIAIRNKIGGAP